MPTAILAVLIHPKISYFRFSGILWAFGVYLEAVSVLPQVRFMQNAKVSPPFFILNVNSLFFQVNILFIYDFICFQIVEVFTGYYVFALGVSRFLALAYWII